MATQCSARVSPSRRPRSFLGQAQAQSLSIFPARHIQHGPRTSLKLPSSRVLSEGKLKPKAVIAVDLFGPTSRLSAHRGDRETIRLKLIADSSTRLRLHYRMAAIRCNGPTADDQLLPAKPLGRYGDGGAVQTNDSELADLIDSLRSRQGHQAGHRAREVRARSEIHECSHRLEQSP